MSAEKLDTMHVAALLTIAAASGLGGNINIPIDPTLQEPNQRNKNLEVWEIFRAYQTAIVKALADTSWPAPPAGSLSSVPSAVSNIVSALATNGNPLVSALVPLATQFIGAIEKTQTPAPPASTAPIPDPGTTPASAS